MKAANPSAIAQEYLAKGRSADCPIIDMHGHWGPLFEGYLPASSDEAMLAVMARAGVKKIVCSSHEALFGDPELGNTEMQAAIDRHQDVLLGYWAVNPNYKDLAKQAIYDFQASRGFVGFKFLPDYHVYSLQGKAYEPVLKYADERKLPVLVHTWGGSQFNSPVHLAAIATDYPDAIFLMGHSGFGDWETALALARDLDNVYLDITAVYVAHDFAMLPGGSGTPQQLMSVLQVNGIIEHMVNTAGSEKVLFGTDLPWYSPHYAAGAVLFAKITDQDRHNILHRNAEKLVSEYL